MNHYRKLHHSFFYRQSTGLIVSTVVLALLAYPIWRTLAAPGALDTSFSGDGKESFIEYAATGIPDVRVQVDPANPAVEKIIVPLANYLAQAPNTLPSPSLRVKRVHPSGAADSSFGISGTATISFSDLGFNQFRGLVTALELQPDGKILVAGHLFSFDGSLIIPCLARLTFAGTLDTTFGNGGRWVYFAHAEIKDMALQNNNGKIILAGRWKPNANSDWRSAIWRFNANGTMDLSFSSDGFFDTSVVSGDVDDGRGFKSVYVQADGKIVALNSPPNMGYRLRRITSSGNLDISLFVNAAADEGAVTIRAVGSNVWVVGAKVIQNVAYGAIFARNSSNGSVDAAFGGGLGMAIAAQPSVWTDITLMPFSFPAKYVVVGGNNYFSSTPALTKAVVTRYLGTGLLDTSFGTNGTTETSGFPLSEMPAQQSLYRSVQCGLSGKIVAAGEGWDWNISPNPFGAIARYWNN